MKGYNQSAGSVCKALGVFSFVFAVFLLNASAQTVLVNYDFASAVAGTPCTASPLTTAAGVTSTFTTGGTGGGTCTTPAGTAATAPPAFIANASNQSVSLTSFAAGSTNFFQFQLSGVGSYQDYMLFFQAQRSGTGPVNADIQYSTNGTTFTTFQTVNPGNGVFAAFNIDLSSVAAIENQPTVYFRILGTGGTSAAGTFRIDNFQAQAIGVSAATVAVSGRVTNASGNPISGAIISIDGGTLSETMYARTNPFGYYTFDGIPAGQSYILSVTAKGRTFNPSNRVLEVLDSVSDADFVSQE